MKTKDLILRTAYNLFQEKSYSEVSIEEICSSCKLTKPAFYYHFKSKAELLIHYYDDVVDHIYRTIETTASDNSWELYVFCFSELIAASVNLGVDLMSQLYITNLEENRGSFDFNERFSSLCVSLIRKAQGTGQIRNQKDADELYLSASFMFTGLELFWSLQKGSFEQGKVFIVALESIFDVAPECSIRESEESLGYQSFMG